MEAARRSHLTMSLRNRLLALSLLTLLLPWSGWKLLQELEGFLREAQENALLSTARALAGALPFESQSLLLYAPDRYVVLRSLDAPPVLDGFDDDWPQADQGMELSSADGALSVRFLAGASANGLFLLFEVRKSEKYPVGATSQHGNRIELMLRSPRGLLRFDIRPEAPGPLQLYSDGGGGQAEGYWLETGHGYRAELLIPAFVRNADLAFTITDRAGRTLAAPAGGRERDTGSWIMLVPEWQDLSGLLAGSVPEAARAWLVNTDGWVLADSGPERRQESQETTWAQRLLYRLVAGKRTAIETAAAVPPVRLLSDAVTSALAGQDGVSWSQDLDTAVVRNLVAVPVRLQGKVRGAIALQSASEGLLLVTNRALGRLLITTLVITFGLAGGLWYFATRLSQRVRRLSGAVSVAMEDGVTARTLPLTADRDELGELARNNQKLLRAVADYNQYLQTLAGKLSHELKTPLAITRSSLDNLSSRPLDDQGRQFLQRAQEGVERQAAIVRAMSEASRLEAAIRVAEWEQAGLGELVTKCAESYRSVHPGRRIETDISPVPVRLRCAPELLAQALDKLVDNALTLSGTEDVVTIALGPVEGEARLSVRNTGTRLPAEFQERLFDSLVSLREKRGPTPHLGLGLYIVRLVAAAHGGRVDARNLPQGQGVEFNMYLPASHAQR